MGRTPFFTLFLLASGDPLPAWLTFDAVSRTFSGVPANDDVGTISIEVIATDSANASTSDVFDLTVANINDAPVLSQPLADLTTTERQPFTLVVPENTFTDPDLGDILSYSAALVGGVPLPSWLTFDPLTRTFSGTPGEDDIGSFSIRVTATDQPGASAFNSINGTHPFFRTAPCPVRVGGLF